MNRAPKNIQISAENPVAAILGFFQKCEPFNRHAAVRFIVNLHSIGSKAELKRYPVHPTTLDSADLIVHIIEG
jgi:hypothetical protein